MYSLLIASLIRTDQDAQITPKQGVIGALSIGRSVTANRRRYGLLSRHRRG